MSNNEKYDAFISYRHCEPDNEIASKIQKKLEGFRFPKDIAKKVGRTRFSRIFRRSDQGEQETRRRRGRRRAYFQRRS